MNGQTLRMMDAKKRNLTVAAWALMVFAPFLQLLVVLLVTGKNPFAAYPVWSDELGYWRGLYSWLHTGLSGGLNGMGEYPAEVGQLGLYGITPMLLYGGFAKLFGWTVHSIVIYNAAWISLASLTFCALVRPKAGLALFVGGLLMVFVPAILYCATSMTELFNYALLLFFFAFLLRYQKNRGKWMLALCWLAVLVGCLYRMVYAALLIPLVWVIAEGRFGRKMLVSAFFGVLLLVGCGFLTTYVSAPARSGFLYNWLRAENSGIFVQMFLSHAKSNLHDYFFRYTGSPMEDMLHYLYIAAMALCLLGTFIGVEKQAGHRRVRFGIHWTALGCFLLLFVPFGIVIMFYETNDWNDFRMLAPLLWGIAVWLAMKGKKLVPAVVLTGSVAMLAVLCTLPPVGAFGDDYRFVQPPYSETMQQACEAVVYDPEAANPYENTVRTDVVSLQVMTELAPGIGILDGWFTPETVGKSRWILTDHLKIVVEGYESVYGGKSANVYRHIDMPVQ